MHSEDAPKTSASEYMKALSNYLSDLRNNGTTNGKKIKGKKKLYSLVNTHVHVVNDYLNLYLEEFEKSKSCPQISV